jgi:hypothetical protein
VLGTTAADAWAKRTQRVLAAPATHEMFIADTEAAAT